MRRLLVLLLLAGAARAEGPTRLGVLLRAYLAETESIARQEELLAEIRRVTGDDPARVAAALRNDEHRVYPDRPEFRKDGAPPVFRGRSFRWVDCADAIARSAGVYADLVLPEDYDRKNRYPLVVDIGEQQRLPEPGAVLVVVHPRAHKLAANEAIAVERLVLGLIAHTMSICPIDADRVFLRGGGRYAELVWYVGFQNPDRFAGLFCGYDYWPGVEFQAPHALYFSVWAVTRGRNDAKLRRGMGELGRFSRAHRLVALPQREGEPVDRMRIQRAAWQQQTTRGEPRTRQALVCIRPFPLRCHWLRVVPKTRSRKEETLGRAWRYDLLPRPATLEAVIDRADGNLVHVKAGNLIAFQIYVDPAVFDVEKPLRVSINGKGPTAHLIVPDIGAMLDDYREHGDPKLLYVARLGFP